MKTNYHATASVCAALAAVWASNAIAQDASMPSMDHSQMDMGKSMTSALGPYPMNREASGTSWQPDASAPMGEHKMHGDWMTMSHADFNLIYDSQGGPRGDQKTFVAGMVMGMAQGPFGGGVLGFHAMLSPDPLIGKRGYPLLFQSGETADGVTHLVDRQHPHDLFMELSASYSRKVGADSAVFVYAGLPGEPAFGPPAFMHRQAAMDDPEAPISHHWLDSTHVTFGVLTAGYSQAGWKVEASSFRGREPDQNRYNIETPTLDSWSGRISFNPSPRWAAQVSYANLTSPEQLEPLQDQTRASASVIYAADWGAATLAWGTKKNTTGPRTDALVLEASYWPDADWTVFGRAERVEENELTPSGAVYRVGKASVGAVRDFAVSPRTKIGLGGLVSAYDIPAGLKGLYGSPLSGMAFVRLKLN